MDIHKIYINRGKEDIYMISTNSNHGRDPMKDSIPEKSIDEENISISSGAKTFFELMENIEEINENGPLSDRRQSLFDLLKEARESMEEEDTTHPLLKCIIIAMRIIKGHKVPLKDEAFLAEHAPDMYLRAILLREENDDPERYESLLKEKKKAEEDVSLDNQVPETEVATEIIEE